MSEKIKIIICDVDGTILPRGEKILTADVSEAINSAVRSGVTFAAASGRSYRELREIFCNVTEKMYFICYDGALVINGGEVIFENPISPDTLKRLEPFSKDTERYTYSTDKVYKMVLKSGSSNSRLCHYAEANRLLKRVYDGRALIEYAAPDTDKAKAVSFLLDRLGITAEEAAAFGDSYNDVGMLKVVKHSYSTENAISQVKMLARYKTDNVAETIKELIQGGR